MIIKDKELTLKEANNIADLLMKIIRKKITKFNTDDDPAEHIYLILHTLSNLHAKMLISLSGYGETYAIEHLSVDLLKKWIEKITIEYMDGYDARK